MSVGNPAAKRQLPFGPSITSEISARSDVESLLLDVHAIAALIFTFIFVDVYVYVLYSM